MPHRLKSLWELLWEHDPNGLIVLDQDLNIILVNPAFCKMFNSECAGMIGRPAVDLLGDVTIFESAWDQNTEIRRPEVSYPKYNLWVKQVAFPIQDEKIVACIMVDLTHEVQQREELTRLKREAVLNVTAVVDKQMHVAQQIAGLLGETTAETKVSLLKLLQMLEMENS